jgi:hypothetical protein
VLFQFLCRKHMLWSFKSLPLEPTAMHYCEHNFF